MIQTVDFFTPIVDDPYMFGQIAAANSLSDVWAMGGEPKVALNIVGFPNCLDPSILGEILKGGADKVMEAGAVLVGGHTIQDDEPKYGLCVSGFVHPKKIFKNYGCRPGDKLILTKQIGNGIVNTAIKAEMVSERAIKEAETVMSSLNKKAKEVVEKYDVSACTDVTGFGLAGHAYKMAIASGCQLHFHTADLPVIPGVMELLEAGCVPGAAFKNLDFARPGLQVAEGLAVERKMLCCDAQTSGGLLMCAKPDVAEAIVTELRQGDFPDAAIVGSVKKGSPAVILD